MIFYTYKRHIGQIIEHSWHPRELLHAPTPLYLSPSEETTCSMSITKYRCWLFSKFLESSLYGICTFCAWFLSFNILSLCCFVYQKIFLIFWMVFFCVNAPLFISLFYWWWTFEEFFLPVWGLLWTNLWALLYHVIIFYRQRVWNLLPSLLLDQNWFQNHFSLLLFSSIISVNIFKC